MCVYIYICTCVRDLPGDGARRAQRGRGVVLRRRGKCSYM